MYINAYIQRESAHTEKERERERARERESERKIALSLFLSLSDSLPSPPPPLPPRRPFIIVYVHNPGRPRDPHRALVRGHLGMVYAIEVAVRRTSFVSLFFACHR
jgi:hypothetical protein